MQSDKVPAAREVEQGHESLLRVARHNSLGVRCVPISASQVAAFSVSSRESSWLGRENSQTSKLAATSTNVFAKADTEITCASGREVPLRDTGGFKVGSNLRPVSVIDPRGDQGSYRTIADTCESTMRGR
jgi:hypothetical protein